MDRRTFLAGLGAVGGAAALGAQANSGNALPIKRAVEFEMLPQALSIADRMQLARDAGFEQVECPTTPDSGKATEMKSAAEKAGLRIHSVMNMDHWKYPLSSSDPAVVERSLAGAKTSLENAHFWGADSVLIVPGVVDATNTYSDVYERSQQSIRKLLPLAEQYRIVIGIEEVWNKFLLSPLEFVRYIDGFKSEWLRAYFDVGNVVLYGYPQDWIRTLGKRIVKLHIKDFSFRVDPATHNRVAAWQPLLEGEIDWRAVHDALRDIGYVGTATVELPGGDAAYLQDVNKRFQRILNGDVG
ncbi:MAG TPA: sugar phosphate isomerase/epimerase family protein [Bryobacteraceae bacterium]|nr:sugar phosphate isomerase/epimerase family protein [Bryobacteraceae bacterium]